MFLRNSIVGVGAVMNRVNRSGIWCVKLHGGRKDERMTEERFDKTGV